MEVGRQDLIFGGHVSVSNKRSTRVTQGTAQGLDDFGLTESPRSELSQIVVSFASCRVAELLLR
jgi:hypothetical protein